MGYIRLPPSLPPRTEDLSTVYSVLSTFGLFLSCYYTMWLFVLRSYSVIQLFKSLASCVNYISRADCDAKNKYCLVASLGLQCRQHILSEPNLLKEL